MCVCVCARAKNIHIFSSNKNLYFKLLKIKGPIQILVSALGKHNYTNKAFETNANNSFKRM